MKPQWAAPSVVVEPDGAGGRRESEAAAEEPHAGRREVGASDSVTRTLAEEGLAQFLSHRWVAQGDPDSYLQLDCLCSCLVLT